jgi:hypothetical protein
MQYQETNKKRYNNKPEYLITQKEEMTVCSIRKQTRRDTIPNQNTT